MIKFYFMKYSLISKNTQNYFGSYHLWTKFELFLKLRKLLLNKIFCQSLGHFVGLSGHPEGCFHFFSLWMKRRGLSSEQNFYSIKCSLIAKIITKFLYSHILMFIFQKSLKSEKGALFFPASGVIWSAWPYTSKYLPKTWRGFIFGPHAHFLIMKFFSKNLKFFFDF